VTLSPTSRHTTTPTAISATTAPITQTFLNAALA
jgi:hypothetical protein